MKNYDICKICERPFCTDNLKNEWCRLCKMVDGKLEVIPLCEECTDNLKYSLGAMRNKELALMWAKEEL